MTTNEHISEVLKALDRAKANVPKDWDYISEDPSIMEQVYEMQYKLKPLGEHLGVSLKLFPSVEQLEDDEVKMIVDNILETWSAYHYNADLPQRLPIRIAYTTLLSVWDEVVGCFPFGNFHFDFYDLDLDQYVR